MAIRLVSFNIFHDRVERAARTKRLATVLAEMNGDIVALQEVATGLFLPGDPVEAVLRTPGIDLPYHVRAWFETNLGIYKNGIALLSRYPIVYSEARAFDRNVFWDRKGFLRADVKTPEGLLHVITLHMRSSGGQLVKDDEFRQLADYVRALGASAPVAILGDFNWGWTHPDFQKFAEEIGARSFYQAMHSSGPLVTWTPNYRDPCNLKVDDEDQQIDNILFIPGKRTTEWTFKDPEIVVPVGAPHPSDHCPVSVDLMFGEPASRSLGSLPNESQRRAALDRWKRLGG